MKFDMTKTYRTRSGKIAEIHNHTERNFAGDLVTFPIKCSIREDKKFARRSYVVLTAEGRASVLGDSGNDIVGEW